MITLTPEQEQQAVDVYQLLVGEEYPAHKTFSICRELVALRAVADAAKAYFDSHCNFDDAQRLRATLKAAGRDV